METIETSDYHPLTELRSQTIHPYTDLLLHDMGAGLADNMGEGLASGSEWRTAPLWNIGYTEYVSYEKLICMMDALKHLKKRFYGMAVKQRLQKKLSEQCLHPTEVNLSHF